MLTCAGKYKCLLGTEIDVPSLSKCLRCEEEDVERQLELPLILKEEV